MGRARGTTRISGKYKTATTTTSTLNDRRVSHQFPSPARMISNLYDDPEVQSRLSAPARRTTKKTTTPTRTTRVSVSSSSSSSGGTRRPPPIRYEPFPVVDRSSDNTEKHVVIDEGETTTSSSQHVSFGVASENQDSVVSMVEGTVYVTEEMEVPAVEYHEHNSMHDALDFDADAEDDELALDIVAASYRNRRRKRRLCFGFVVLLLGLVGVFVGIGFSIAKAAKGGDDEEKADAVVQMPLVNLKEICSVENIATKLGHAECAGACAHASCCMKAGDESCFLEFEDVCGMYSPCGTLHTQTEFDEDTPAVSITHVPPPPTNLKDICSDMNLMEIDGYIRCESSCHPGNCCRAADASANCRASHRHVCDNYDPCVVLDEGSEHPSLESIVSSKCQRDMVDTEDGRKACESICQARSCCFASDDRRNCRVDNKVWCKEFQACEILFTNSIPSGTFVEPSIPKPDHHPSELKQRCAKSSMVTHKDLVYCEDGCKPALCCFRDVPCDDSQNAAKIDCDDYDFCLPLLADSKVGGVDDAGTDSVGNDTFDPDPMPPPPPPEDTEAGTDEYPIEKAPEGLEDICNQDIVHDDPDVHQDCEELCNPALCCVGLRGDCANAKKEICKTYRSCMSVWAPELQHSA